jgi:hypothetical protein
MRLSTDKSRYERSFSTLLLLLSFVGYGVVQLLVVPWCGSVWGVALA